MCKEGGRYEQGGTCWKLNRQPKLWQNKVAPLCVVEGPKGCHCTSAVRKIQPITVGATNYSRTKVEGGACEHTVREDRNKVRVPLI